MEFELRTSRALPESVDQSTQSQTLFDTIPDALKAIRNGECVVVVDDERPQPDALADGPRQLLEAVVGHVQPDHVRERADGLGRGAHLAPKHLHVGVGAQRVLTQQRLLGVEELYTAMHNSHGRKVGHEAVALEAEACEPCDRFFARRDDQGLLAMDLSLVDDFLRWEAGQALLAMGAGDESTPKGGLDGLLMRVGIWNGPADLDEWESAIRRQMVTRGCR